MLLKQKIVYRSNRVVTVCQNILSGLIKVTFFYFEHLVQDFFVYGNRVFTHVDSLVLSDLGLKVPGVSSYLIDGQTFFRIGA